MNLIYLGRPSVLFFPYASTRLLQIRGALKIAHVPCARPNRVDNFD